MFKKIKLLILAAFFSTLIPSLSLQASETDHFHYDLQVELFPEEHKLKGKARITMPETEHKTRFFLAPTVRVDQVSLEGREIEHSFSNGILEVILPQETDDAQATLHISYQARFDNEAPHRPMHTEDPTHGVSAVIKKEGTFLSGRSGWYPDQGHGAATWRLSITAPPGYLAVTAGSLAGHATTPEYSLSVWIVNQPLPSLTVSAGPYEVSSDLERDIPVYAYFYPESRDLARDYIQAARRHLDFYQDLLGPYPFEKFAVVENFFPTGYGFPSWTLLGSAVIRLPFIMETSLPHEIAHSWWGNGVRVDYSQGNWSEAITTYVADYLLQERSSEEAARDYRLRTLRGYSSLVTAEKDFPLSGFISRHNPESQAIGYGKGAMVFHMLRRKVGDEIFWDALRLMIRENMFQEAGWDDFEETFSDLADKDLRTFFEQWVQKPGGPLLALHDVQLTGRENDWTVKGKIIQEEPYFDIRLHIHLETEGQPKKVELNLDGSEKSFELKTASRPLRLRADPDAHVFRRLHPGEIPATVERIRGSESLIAVAASSLSQKEARAAQVLLQALNRENIPLISEEDTTEKKLQNRDVLFLGLPRDYADPLFDQTDGTELWSSLGFTDGGQLSSPDSALFAAVNPPGDPETTWAYFVSSSPEAARDAARRIPHYGRYSYLLFAGGEVRIRETRDPEQLPLEHVFVN